MSNQRGRWTIAGARKELSKLIASAAREPQAVYRRDKLVATVVSPALGEQIEAAKVRTDRPLIAALADLRQLCSEEDYVLDTPLRRNRGTKRNVRR